MEKYDHKKIEKKWQEKWQKNEAFKIDKDDKKKEKFYILDMFPYPSGDGLHMGHTESYTSTDIFYRFKKMQGYNVLHPQGFDSFGLPAENYAIKTGVKPKETTKKNIENYIRQMQSLGLAYDFSEKLVTSSPEYYKWTQWIFNKFFEDGLVYKKTDTINWCDSCKTGLANEQVENGKCERCKNEVIQKEVPGWFFKITDFADELIEDMKDLDWPEHTKKNQINWIGRSEGSLIKFKIILEKNSNKGVLSKDGDQTDPRINADQTQNYAEISEFEVFTTRADTLFGVTYCVLAPENKLVEELKDGIENWNEVEAYMEKTKRKTEMERKEGKEKTGVELKGVKVINPANNEEVPLFISDYVLAGYGTGAVMAVPAHDERDFEFANKFGIEIKEVIMPYFTDNGVRDDRETIERHNVLVILQNKKGETLCLEWADTWKSFLIGGVEDGESVVEAAKREVLEESGYKNIKFIKQLGHQAQLFFAPHKDINRKAVVSALLFELEDEEKNDVAEEELEKHKPIWIKNEEVENFINLDNNLVPFYKIKKDEAFTGYGKLLNSGKFDGMDSEEAKKAITEFVGGKVTRNYRLRDWSISRQRYWGAPIPIVYSPEGEAHAVPEEYLPWTLPEDVDFVPTGTAPLAKSKELYARTEKIFGKGWIPEVDTMDTFVDSSWYFLRYPNPHNEKEFCSKDRLKHWLPVDLYIGGAEHTYMHLLYARFFVKAMNKLGLVDFKEPFTKLRHQGMVLDDKGVKMSKSKGNVINPDDMVERFGADAVRMYMMFAGPLEDDVMWNENGVVGVYRFLEKVWSFVTRIDADQARIDADKKMNSLIHKTIKKVTEDIENLKFNTAISQMMILANNMEKEKEIFLIHYSRFLILLSPFAPHITEELWSILGNKGSIYEEVWPEYDLELAKDEKINFVIQVNGKLRDVLEADAEASEEEIKKLAKESEKIKKWIEEKEVKKEIFVKGRLLNLIV